MIHKTHIIITLIIFVELIAAGKPDCIIIEIDDERAALQESLLAEKRSLTNYIEQQHNQQWAKYDEITDCCCLTALCLPCVSTILEPLNIVNPNILLLNIFSAGAAMLAIDYYAKPSFSKEQRRIEEINRALKEKSD